METPKKPLKTADTQDSAFDQDEITDSSTRKKFVDEDEDDLDMPLDDVAYEDFGDYDDEDDY